jgi:protein involved in polysaccharide export with SLBB domain
MNLRTRFTISRANWIYALFAATLLAILGQAAFADEPATPPADATTSFEASYRLGAGDKLKLIVFGEENLSGEFTVDDSGNIALPLVGTVKAQGKSLGEFEAIVVTSLKNGYLKDPHVSVEVLNYRPFYIIGEVTKGGQYPYQAGLTVLNAVAIAGGYTFRADTGEAFITRSGHEIQFDLKAPVIVYPGDVVRIPERFF